MASLARPVSFAQPLRSSRPTHSSKIRSFSTSQSRNAGAGQGFNLSRMPKQPSMATRMKNMRPSEIPNDIGVLPMTYIRPCGNMPSFFTQPRIRLRLEWHYLRQSFSDLAQAILSTRWQVEKDPVTGKRMKKPLEFRERYTLARDLHTRFYKAVAQGDKATISKIACSGLENQQLGQIESRRLSDKPGLSWGVKYQGWVLPRRLYWTIQSLIPSWFKAIHVVSDRRAPLPVGPDTTVRQVIFRVDSKQTLNRNDGSAPVTKSLREYVVLQRRTIEGKAEDWRIQGTVLPTDTEGAMKIIDNLKAEEQKSGRLTFMEQVKSRMGAVQ